MPPAPPASIASAAAFVTASGALKRGEVTLLRSGLETTKRLLNVGMLTGGFDQLFIECGVLVLCFHRIHARTLQRFGRGHASGPLVMRDRNPMLFTLLPQCLNVPLL